MYRIGIDVGSTYTKYCFMNENLEIITLDTEKTPVRQKEYFEKKISELKKTYPNAAIVSCGYGRKNILSIKQVNELTALAKGVEHIKPGAEITLDIGGQDTKLIRQQYGRLKEFYVNDKCAAGSGMFLSNICNLLEMDFQQIPLGFHKKDSIGLSSVCAVFAQSEIIELLAKNVAEDVILVSVIRQILLQAKQLLEKVEKKAIVLSGGLAQISGIEILAEEIWNRECIICAESNYYSAIGCALFSQEEG